MCCTVCATCTKLSRQLAIASKCTLNRVLCFVRIGRVPPRSLYSLACTTSPTLVLLYTVHLSAAHCAESVPLCCKAHAMLFHQRYRISSNCHPEHTGQKLWHNPGVTSVDVGSPSRNHIESPACIEHASSVGYTASGMLAAQRARRHGSGATISGTTTTVRSL